MLTFHDARIDSLGCFNPNYPYRSHAKYVKSIYECPCSATKIMNIICSINMPQKMPHLSFISNFFPPSH